MKAQGNKRLTDDSAPYLGKKHDARGNFKVLANLEICCKGNRSCYNVVAPHGKLFFLMIQLKVINFVR